MAKRLDPKEVRLAGVSLFANADKRAIQSLATIVDEVDAPAGRILISEGHRNSEILIIESGTASVDVGGEEIAELGPGDFAGELGFFVGTKASATVRAKTELDLMVIPYNRFDQVLEENPSLWRVIATELAERLYATDARLM